MNINKVYINNFKNYSGEHTFDLTKKITIIVGKNGFGKSSFFDAIEWCLTGQINRFNKKEFNPKDVLNFNDYGINKQCKVQIFFNGHILERSFKYQNEKLGNIKVKLTHEDGTVINGQANIDDFLKNNYFRTNKENSEFFGELLKQSHLLSQDQVSDFISKESPKDRFNSLAEILGLKNVLYTFENLEQIKKATNKKVDNLKGQITTINIQKNERRKDLAFIDHKTIYSVLKELKIKDTFRNSFENLEKLKKIEEENLFNNKRQIQAFEKYIDMGYKSVDEINTHLQKLKSNIDLTENDIKAKKQLKNKVQTLHITLRDQSHKFEELNNLNNEIKLKMAQINHSEYKNLNTDEVRNILSIENQEVLRIEYSMSYQKSYIEKKQFLKNVPLQIDELKIKLQFLYVRTERLNKLLESLNQRISQKGNGNTIKLLDHLKGILNFIEENENEQSGRCPVCSVVHGEKLTGLIHTNIQQHNDYLKKDAMFAEKNLAMKSRLIQKKEFALTTREDINNQLDNLSKTQNNYKDQIERIMNSSMFSLNYMENFSLKELQSLKQDSMKKITNLNELLTNKLEYEKLTKKLDVLKKVVGTSHSSTNIHERQIRLKRAEGRLNNYLINKEILKENLENEYKKIYKEFTEIEPKEKHQHLKIEIQNLNNLSIETEKKLKKITQLLEIRQLLELNKKIGKDIKRYYFDRKVINQKINRLSRITNSIESFMDSMNEKIGNQTTSFLNAQNSLIQKFYRYLNPMSNNNGVQFEAINGELNIFFPIKGEKDTDVLFNVKHTLSSGQLNVLAISIFLAINESQKVSKLDFIAIDDPIQNMDDVNRFSICDVLSDLKKQVILSTHDMEFVKLLVKKNQHKSDQIQVYILESPLLEADRVKQVRF